MCELKQHHSNEKDIAELILSKDNKIKELEDRCNALGEAKDSALELLNTIWRNFGADQNGDMQQKVHTLEYVKQSNQLYNMARALGSKIDNSGDAEEMLKKWVGMYGYTGLTNCPICVLNSMGNKNVKVHKIRLKTMGSKGNFIFYACDGFKDAHKDEEIKRTSVRLICPHCGNVNESITANGTVTNSLYEINNLTAGKGDAVIHSEETSGIRRVVGDNILLLTCKCCGHMRLEKVHSNVLYK